MRLMVRSSCTISCADKRADESQTLNDTTNEFNGGLTPVCFARSWHKPSEFIPMPYLHLWAAYKHRKGCANPTDTNKAMRPKCRGTIDRFDFASDAHVQHKLAALRPLLSSKIVALKHNRETG